MILKKNFTSPSADEDEDYTFQSLFLNRKKWMRASAIRWLMSLDWKITLSFNGDEIEGWLGSEAFYSWLMAGHEVTIDIFVNE